MNTKEFFNQLYPNFDKNKNVIEVFPLDLDKRPVNTLRRFCLSLDEVVSYARELDATRQYHVYFRCPELKHGSSSGTEKDIDCHTFLYADLDLCKKNKNGNIIKSYTKDELLKSINDFILKPSIIVDSGNGFHVYFLLETPICDLSITRTLLSAIADKLQADKNATKLTQLLRVPGTHNLKTEIPKEVKIISYNKHRYALEEITSTLLDNIQYSFATRETSINSTTNHIRFDFSTPPTPLNITIDNFPDLLDCLKKQNIFLASNNPDFPIGKSFNCIFHPDEHPSANVFISNPTGYYYYKCFGCGLLYDIVTLYQKVKKKNFAESIMALAKLFGINFKYKEFIIKQWEKYYQNASVLENFEDFGYHEMYPNLYKLLKPRIHYMSLINHYGLAKISSDKYLYNEENLFFFSYEYFARKHNIGVQTLVRNVNLFVTLGLIKKVPIDDIPSDIAQKAIQESKEKRHLNTINFYILPNLQDVLPEAEIIAKKLLDNNFCITTCMNKIFLIKVLGQEFANLVYPDERSITPKSLSLAKRLETTLLKLIETQGYATKDQIISKTIVSGRMKATREDKERELQRNLSLFLKQYNLEYITANKSLKEKFGLKRYIKIIIPKEIQ